MEYAPPETAPEVLHVDAHLLVVGKPAGLLSVPGKGPALRDCVIERLRQSYPEVLLVHRLDRDTSGVMVFALTPHAQRHLGLQFEHRQVEKGYVALVSGRPTQGEGRVDLPLIVDWPNRPRQKICHETGRAAVTDWRMIGPAGPDASRIALTPRTGRSHQLRVHMLALGHPILGDSLYAEGVARDHPRLMLHAERLELRHPDGGRVMRFDLACPF
ncbi:pseudouridine synthase [Rhodobaculum claviforme]|uniref:Dual-specificity RNA pseudouridine synthase RluA n=1 Tax=Rhodobaculum claviforme TaxID=1549854 RepID=A0A934TLT6_9RHOB|nr:pseudouridine synthase [Rhodobaculum claviforme]MBK5928222.1 RNA pseudouridine synthase [Rhodobaculum claviforme]